MFQVLALCQSETDAGAHWQMVSCELCVSTLFALIQCRPQINSIKASQDNEIFFFYLQIKLGGFWDYFQRDKKELVL